MTSTVFDHTDQHGDRLTVTRAPAGGFTFDSYSSRYRVGVQVWLPDVETVHLAAVLTREETRHA